MTVDNTAPSVSASVIAPSAGSSLPGFIAQGGSYFVYATITDGVAGVSSATANVSTISAGQTAVALTTTGGPWTVGGTSYTYRSALQTADAVLAAGSKSYTVSATDNATNSASASFSVTVDNTGPTVSASVIAPSTGSATPGFVKKSGTYYVYANATDASAGVSAVSANVSTVSAGQTAAAMTTTGGPWTIGGVSYAWRSAVLTADATLTAGAKSYTVSATDNANTTATATFSVTADITVPVVSGATIAPAAGSTTPGFIAQGGSYFVYANATDASAGISSVSADTSTISAGQTSVALSATGGPWTVGGVSYTFRSSALTADAVVAAGAKTYTVSATDNAANSATASFSVTVDNTAPTVSASVIAPSVATSLPGFIKQGGSYYVYATATDASSGISSLTANVVEPEHGPDRRQPGHHRAARGR